MKSYTELNLYFSSLSLAWDKPLDSIWVVGFVYDYLHHLFENVLIMYHFPRLYEYNLKQTNISLMAYY